MSRPFWKQFSGVEHHARWRDRRNPVFDRLLHAVFGRAVVDLRAGVIDAVTDHRPAVVPAFAHHVDLVAAARTVLDVPGLAGRRIDRERLYVAMSITPDFSLRVG